MSRINRWKLAEELTVYQISLLLAGHDPSEFDDQDPSDWRGGGIGSEGEVVGVAHNGPCGTISEV